jgi:hypothetical protein
MRKDLAKAVEEENAKHTDSESLKERYEEIKKINMQYYAEASGFQTQYEKVKSLHERIEMREENRKQLMSSMTVLDGQSRPILMWNLRGGAV